MRKKIGLLLLAILVVGSSADAKKGVKGNQKAKVAIDYLNSNFGTYDKLQKTIWANPELGFLETNSSGLLKQHLRENGFTIEEGVAGMPTAFVATYGSGQPVIGFLAEFDALPGLSQDTVPYRKPLKENAPGQGCGHNTFGVASSAAAVSLSKWLAANNQNGTVKVYGTPAEEGGAGKVYLVREGFFNGVDVVLDWHPSSVNAVSTNGGTAMVMVDYKFYGKPAHAAGNPWKGRSALDAVEALDYMVNLLREHVPTSSRIHYVIPDGGFAPNVVPEYARVSYYIRSPKRDILNTLTEWIDSAAVGAATFVPGSPGHSWQNVAADGTTIGTKGLLNASRVFALTAVDLFTDAKLLQAVKDEFNKEVGPDFKYVPLLGDRKPALDYRVVKKE